MSTLLKFHESRHQHIPNYVGELRQRIGYYLGYIPQPYADQPTSDSAYEMILRDDEVSRCLNLLSLSVAGERCRVLADDKRIAQIGTWALNQIHDFLHVRSSLTEKAVLFGLGIQRKYYERKRKFGLDWEVVNRCQEVDRRRFRLERDEKDRSKLYWTMWSLPHDKFVILEDRSHNPQAPDGASVHDYIWYINRWEEMSPYHSGIAENIYLLVYIKRKALEYWSDLAERWSKPFLVAAIDVMKAAITANLGNAGYMTLQERIDAILETFEKCRAKHIAVVDKDDHVQMVEAGSTGANIIRELVEHCDRKIHLNFMGTELAAGTGGVGSYALGDIHREGFDTIIVSNRLREGEVLCDSLLLDDFFIRNWRNLRALDIPQPDRGEVRIKIECEGEELEKQARAEKQAQGKRPSA